MIDRHDAFAFSIATPADEPEIRRLVGSVPMAGGITVRFAREPDYFLGTTTMGDVCDVLIARHEPDGELAGVLCWAVRWHLVNGVPRRVGWIGQVRASPRFRGRWLLHRGLPLFRERGQPDLLHVAVIASENARARAVMIERRPPGGLHARRLAGITTRALLLRRGQGTWGRATRLGVAGLEIATAAAVGVDPVVAFLRATGAGRQLFPAWTPDDLLGGTALRGMGLADVAVATRHGAVVGTLGCWDQRAFKQDVVHAYPPALRRCRTAWNLVAAGAGAPALPPEGAAIPSAFAALACVADDDPGVLRSLLDRVARMAARRGCGYLLLGLTDQDPLAAAVGRWPHITYRSDLFAYSWTHPVPGSDLDERVPYVEIGTL